MPAAEAAADVVLLLPSAELQALPPPLSKGSPVELVDLSPPLLLVLATDGMVGLRLPVEDVARDSRRWKEAESSVRPADACWSRLSPLL